MTNIESGQLFSFTDRVFEDALTACHLSAYLGTSNLSLGPNFPTFVRRKTRPIHMMRPHTVAQLDFAHFLGIDKT